jgi:RNA polymerase sigma-70 factor (ECF subfamily)
MASTETQINDAVAAVYRSDSRRVFATLVRLLGDFDLAEEAMHEAFASAVEQWATDGVPANPRAWLVSTGRFKAIDMMRRRARFDASLESIARRLDSAGDDPAANGDDEIQDDRLRLIFTCSHPALPAESRVALTLREVCSLTTEQIGRAFLASPATIAQRIVRAKAKIRDAKIPYQVPALTDLPERLETVLQVIYLVFNEGYSASSGTEMTRADLSGEAIRLGRLLTELLSEPEVIGLLSLMLLQESRRAARTTADGDLVLLEDQDRSLWNQEQIAEGVGLIERSLASQQVGPYSIQATIAATHAQAATPAETDWAQICRLYDLLARIQPSPIVELNRAVAIAMRDGPAAGLANIDSIAAQGDLADYHLLHAARADLYRRLGDTVQAKIAYERALDLARQEAERRFLKRRLRELS